MICLKKCFVRYPRRPPSSSLEGSATENQLNYCLESLNIAKGNVLHSEVWKKKKEKNLWATFFKLNQIVYNFIPEFWRRLCSIGSRAVFFFFFLNSCYINSFKEAWSARQLFLHVFKYKYNSCFNMTTFFLEFVTAVCNIHILNTRNVVPMRPKILISLKG